MKMLLIYPPQWNPTSPYLSVPLLAGQLKAAGYECDTMDMNILFFNSILTSSHIKSCLAQSREIYSSLREEIFSKYDNPEKAFPSLPIEGKTKLLKFRKMSSFLESGLSQLDATHYNCGNTAGYTSDKMLTLDEIAESVDNAVRILRDRVDFYEPEKLFDAKMVLQEALKIASLPYAPNEIIWDNYFANPLLNMDWVNIDSQCKDRSVNMFIDFFEKKAEQLAASGYDCICISVPDLSQIIGAFTLARILRSKTDARIVLGGNYITQNKDSLINHPEIFGEYCHIIMTGDGEQSILTLAEYISGKCNAEDIPGSIHINSDGVVIAAEGPGKFPFSESAYADYSGYDFSLYYSPYTVMPFQFSKGCYWGKCKFCDYYYGQQCFDIKSVDRALDEIQYYVEKYGIRHFLFVDEAIPPVYYHRFAKAVIERKLEIYYYSFARLEKEFTDQVLQDMYKSGARILMWGYECYEERLIKMMNKGIDAGERMRILGSSHNAGIWNNALFIIGYPTETMEEINRTLDVIKNNRDIINSCTPSNFSLKKNTILAKETEENHINGFTKNGEIYTVYNDNSVGTSQQNRREIRRQFHLDFISENCHCLWPVSYSDFDCTLLYLSKYDLDYVSGYRSERHICPMFR